MDCDGHNFFVKSLASDCTVRKKYIKSPATSLLEPRWEDGGAGVSVISAGAVGVIASGAVAGGVIVSTARGERGAGGTHGAWSAWINSYAEQTFSDA